MSKIKWFGPVVAVAMLALAMGGPGAEGKGKPGGGGGGGGGLTLGDIAFVYNDVLDGGLFLLNSDGSVSQRLTSPANDAKDRLASWSPDGVWLAFFRHPDASKIFGNLYIVSPDGSEQALVDSYFDDAGPIPSHRNDDLTWAPDGTRLVFAGGVYGSGDALWLVDLANLAEPTTKLINAPGGQANSPAFSPDLDAELAGYQGLLAFRDVIGGRADIWTVGIDIDESGRLSVGALDNLTWDALIADYGHPAWSPDGSVLACTMDETTESGSAGTFRGIVLVASDSSITPLTSTITLPQISWSPDGQYLAFDDQAPGKGGVTYDIFRIDLAGTNVVNVTATGHSKDREVDSAWNPAWVNDLDF